MHRARSTARWKVQHCNPQSLSNQSPETGCYSLWQVERISTCQLACQRAGYTIETECFVYFAGLTVNDCPIATSCLAYLSVPCHAGVRLTSPNSTYLYHPSDNVRGESLSDGLLHGRLSYKCRSHFQSGTAGLTLNHDWQGTEPPVTKSLQVESPRVAG